MAEAQATKDSNVETVKLTDGRLVDFAGKRKMLKEALIEEDGTVKIRIDFRNGETRTYKLPDQLLLKFAGHGAEQKYGDETAGETDVDDMVLAVDNLDERIQKLEWSSRKEGGGMSGTSVLLRAIMEGTGQTQEKVKAFLANKTQAWKVAARNSARFKPIVDRLEAEKAAKAGGGKIDVNADLAELDEAVAA